MKKIAVLTSGGDAAGMNAAIRAATRTAIEDGLEVVGVRNGYAGLITSDFVPLGLRDVGGHMQHGGTMLGSARSAEFRGAEGRERAVANLRAASVDGLVVIGGNGSQTGSQALSAMGLPVVGVASTIDNDLYGSEITLGVDTALNVALEAIDRLKVTASSHRRAFLVEVMGRDCGYLALMAGIAGGAEAVAIPEIVCDPEKLAQEIRSAYDRGKPHALIVVAEGAKYNAAALMAYFESAKDRLGFTVRSTVLGYVQRGAAPTYADRMLGTRLGSAAASRLAAGEHGVLVGVNRGEVTTTPLDLVVRERKPLDPERLRLAQILSK
jgi:6-phosphofructokinase 1